jgi:uncharacterized protein
MKILDSHIHANFRSKEEFAALAERGYAAAVTCAFFPLVPRGPDTILDLWDMILRRYTGELRGVEIRAALGMHPRSIPKKDASVALAELPEFLKREDVVAVGEVGLEVGSNEEKEILAAQLEIAAESNIPIILHTPRENKLALFKEEMKILDSVGNEPELIIVDHNDEITLHMALERGHYAGLTISNGKLDPERATALIKEELHYSDMMLLNSDLGYSSKDIFSLVDGVAELEKSIEPKVLERIAYSNAAELFCF